MPQVDFPLDRFCGEDITSVRGLFSHEWTNRIQGSASSFLVRKHDALVGAPVKHKQSPLQVYFNVRLSHED